MHLHLVMAAWEIRDFSAAPFHLKILKTILVLFDTLREKN